MAKSRHFMHSTEDGQASMSRDSVIAGNFRRDLSARRSFTLNLPEFLLYALEARVLEANDGEAGEDQSTLKRLHRNGARKSDHTPRRRRGA